MTQNVNERRSQLYNKKCFWFDVYCVTSAGVPLKKIKKIYYLIIISLVVNKINILLHFWTILGQFFNHHCQDKLPMMTSQAFLRLGRLEKTKFQPFQKPTSFFRNYDFLRQCNISNLLWIIKTSILFSAKISFLDTEKQETSFLSQNVLAAVYQIAQYQCLGRNNFDYCRKKDYGISSNLSLFAHTLWKEC